MMSLHSTTRPGKHSGKQIRGGIGPWGSKPARSGGASPSEASRLAEMIDFSDFWAVTMPETAVSPRQYAFCCFPHASPVFETGAGKQKTAPKGHSNALISLEEIGAGEGIRTLDPNLGKGENSLRPASPWHDI